ncbi:hypothetical protein BN946_scf184654.g14 [Trametes cinnabarina]|uniref:Uncharacterized protein n=1 Tax=Pycnoporus cinnabarinus TaxID=5643 RepID=A0A060SMC3_PYCCI|nr:hypothetical protein BN946_scf184654.g14 [Trametes cinnabarina]
MSISAPPSPSPSSSASPSLSPITSPTTKRPLPTEPELTASGRRKPKMKHDESPFIHFGRHYVRAIEMFTLPSTIITAGLLRDPDANDDSYSALENRHYSSSQILVKLVPTFTIILEKDDTAPQEIQKWLDDFAGCLLQGASGAKSDDMSSLWGAVIDWLKKDFRGNDDAKDLDREVKAGRGFCNSITGRLLCLAILDWNDENVQTELINGAAKIDGNLVNGSHWPSLLYAGTFNPDLSWVGFLQGKYLLRTYCHIFTLPSSAKGETVAPTLARSTRCGNAAIFGMTEVTPASIAYAAAQLFFALSESAVFSKTQKMCDASGLYNVIRDWFEEPLFTIEHQAVLMWWNRQVFPTHHAQLTTVNHGLEQMREAQRKQAALAQAPSSGNVTEETPGNSAVGIE